MICVLSGKVVCKLEIGFEGMLVIGDCVYAQLHLPKLTSAMYLCHSFCLLALRLHTGIISNQLLQNNRLQSLYNILDTIELVQCHREEHDTVSVTDWMNLAVCIPRNMVLLDVYDHAQYLLRTSETIVSLKRDNSDH